MIKRMIAHKHTLQRIRISERTILYPSSKVSKPLKFEEPNKLFWLGIKYLKKDAKKHAPGKIKERHLSFISRILR